MLCLRRSDHRREMSKSRARWFFLFSDACDPCFCSPEPTSGASDCIETLNFSDHLVYC